MSRPALLRPLACLLTTVLACAAVAACSPGSIGITGPGAQAQRPEFRPQNNNQSLPTVGVPNDPNGYAPSVVPTTGPGGRYYGY